MGALLPVLADANVLVKDVVSFVFYDLCNASVIDLRWTPHIEAEYTEHRARLRAEAEGREPDGEDWIWAARRMDPIKKWLVSDFLPPGWDADGARLALLRRRVSFAPLLALPDPDDVHVALAAADWARELKSDVILATENLRDLPAKVLQPFGVIALHPGDVLELAYQSAPDAASVSLLKTAADFKNPKFEPADLLRSIRHKQQFSNSQLADVLERRWGLAKPAPAKLPPAAKKPTLKRS